MRTKYSVEFLFILITFPAKPLKDKPDDLKWAVAEVTDAQQLISLERKMNRKTARKARRNNETTKVCDSVKDVELDTLTGDTVQSSPAVNMELNHTTVLYLSNKEFNKNGIEILKEMILEDDGENQSLHRLLFSGKDEAKQLLDIECKFFFFKLPYREHFEQQKIFHCSAKSQRLHNRFNWSRVHTTVKLQHGNRN